MISLDNKLKKIDMEISNKNNLVSKHFEIIRNIKDEIKILEKEKKYLSNNIENNNQTLIKNNNQSLIENNNQSLIENNNKDKIFDEQFDIEILPYDNLEKINIFGEYKIYDFRNHVIIKKNNITIVKSPGRYMGMRGNFVFILIEILNNDNKKFGINRETKCINLDSNEIKNYKNVYCKLYSKYALLMNANEEYVCLFHYDLNKDFYFESNTNFHAFINNIIIYGNNKYIKFADITTDKILKELHPEDYGGTSFSNVITKHDNFILVYLDYHDNNVLKNKILTINY